MTVPDDLRTYGIMSTRKELKFKLSYKYAVVVVILFTVFKHVQMIYVSIWTNMDVSVLADEFTIYKI